MNPSESWILVLMGAVYAAMMIGLIIFAVNKSRKYKKYFQGLDKDDQKILEGRRCKLGASLDLRIEMRFYRGGPLPAKISGDPKLVPLIEALENLKPEFWELPRTNFTLDGKADLLVWTRSSEEFLPWVKTLARAVKAIAHLRDRTPQDIRVLFASKYWPRCALPLLDYLAPIVDQEILRMSLDDKGVRHLLQGKGSQWAFPVSMIFRPPGDFWPAEEGVQHFQHIPAPYLPLILGELGEKTLLRNKEQFWAQMRGFPQGGEKIIACLRWLRTQPGFIVNSVFYFPDFLNQGFFSIPQVRTAALKLLFQLPPDREILRFLEKLPKDQEIQEARAKMISQLEEVSGSLSFISGGALSQPKE